MHLLENTLLTIDLDIKVNVTLIIAQYPLHYITYAPEKFEGNTSNGLVGDAFTRKCII